MSKKDGTPLGVIICTLCLIGVIGGFWAVVVLAIYKLLTALVC